MIDRRQLHNIHQSRQLRKQSNIKMIDRRQNNTISTLVLLLIIIHIMILFSLLSISLLYYDLQSRKCT
jgi:cell division protein FtsL